MFEILGPNNEVLDRITSARHASEARALFWRRRGRRLLAPFLESFSDASIQQRVTSMARARGLVPPQLPLSGGQASTTPRRPRTRSGTPSDLPHPDLFGMAIEAVGPELSTSDDHNPTDVPVTTDTPEPAEPPRPASGVLSPEHVPVALMAQFQGFRSSDPADSYLYWVATSEEAGTVAVDGLSYGPDSPVLLTERRGVAYFLSLVLDDDVPPDAVAVLRVRRLLVEPHLEPDQDATRRADAACYRLGSGC